ncbi:hypothetical protein BJX96DRAFT_58059 [Aspergillus floccosus]
MREQVKLACLACRASKTRCDGQNPCTTCVSNERECLYRPSRRGGARRGIRRENAKRTVVPNLSTLPSPQQLTSSEASGSSINPLPPSKNTLGATGTSVADRDPELSSEGRVSASASHTCANPVTGLAGGPEKPSLVLRAYQNEDDLVNAYYIYIHPYFPLLPQPARPQYEDRPVALSVQGLEPNSSLLPFRTTSSLSLALMSILVLIPFHGDAQALAGETVLLRRSYAELFAQAALNSAQDVIEGPCLSTYTQQSPVPESTAPRSSFLAKVPLELEPVLALSLLSMYEYCQRGSRWKMRARANLALTTAMDMSLHTLSPEVPESVDAKRRAWWATVFSVYQSSICNATSPIIYMDDPRITTPLTEFRCCLEPWPLLVRAQDTLLQASSISTELACERNGAKLENSLPARVRTLDSQLLALVAESDRCRCITNQQGAEAFATRTMWEIARAFIHTSRVTLHCLRAFPDQPFLGQYFRPTSPSAAPQLSSARIMEIEAVYPFTEQESLITCLKSSLAVSRIFAHLAAPNPHYSDAEFLADRTPSALNSPPLYPRSLPYTACCELQSASVLVVVLEKVRARSCSGDFKPLYFLLNNPQMETEKQDVERLSEELQNGVKALLSSLRRNSIFEAVGIMVREVEEMYKTVLTQLF